MQAVDGASLVDTSAPLWGEFGGRCLAGACRVSPEMFLPGASVLGLVKSGSYLLGTWRTDDGAIHRVLRSLGAYDTQYGCTVFSTRAGGHLLRQADEEASAWRGGLRVGLEGEEVHYRSHDGRGFHHAISGESATWVEDGLLSTSGALVATPTQWFNPWRGGGGGYAMTMKFRARGTIFGRPADGFFAHETHFFPAGLHFMNSPYGWGGREVHWGHMATAFEDGTIVDASLAYGPEGWGFAMLVDEAGRFHCATDVRLSADVRPNGYPEQIVYRFLDQEWVWRICPNGERESMHSTGMIGAEGVLTRPGETRRVVAAMGTIDWWTDGRASALPRATPK